MKRDAKDAMTHRCLPSSLNKKNILGHQFFLQIDLSNNKLRTISESFVPWKKMSHVNLQKNPWHCDCSIQWMLDNYMTFMYKNYPKYLHELR